LKSKLHKNDLHLGIGAGEDEAISLAVELGVAVLMDERVGRVPPSSEACSL